MSAWFRPVELPHTATLSFALYTGLSVAPVLLLALHAALFGTYVAASVWAVLRLGWVHGQVVLYASWVAIVAALWVSPRPEPVYDDVARIAYLYQAPDAQLNGQEVMASHDAAVDWEATAFWALALPPTLYCFALILCIVGFALAR